MQQPRANGLKPADLAASDQGMRDILKNAMARRAALYDGHPAASAAATSLTIARQVRRLIKVDYEVLPHITDVEAAIAPDNARFARSPDRPHG